MQVSCTWDSIPRCSWQPDMESGGWIFQFQHWTGANTRNIILINIEYCSWPSSKSFHDIFLFVWEEELAHMGVSNGQGIRKHLQTYNIDKQVLAGRSNIFSCVVETQCPDRPSDRMCEYMSIRDIIRGNIPKNRNRPGRGLGRSGPGRTRRFRAGLCTRRFLSGFGLVTVLSIVAKGDVFWKN